MKVLVTGAAGFIGFHLVRTLLEEAHGVIGIDNLNDYYDVNLKYDRLKELGIQKKDVCEGREVFSKKNTRFRFLKMDIIDLPALEELYEHNAFEQVVHLAGQAGVRYSLKNPHVYVQSNLVGYVNVLECCRKYTVKHLIYASSSSVYGMNKKVPYSEEDRVDCPVSLYAATKKSNELLAHTYSHLYKLPTTGLRFFTAYGPWGRPDMAPMIFADAIFGEQPIKVFNQGDMERDFTYIDDIIGGIVRLMTDVPTLHEPQPFYRLFNIGNSQPVRLMDFIRELEGAMSKKAVLDMYPMQAGDVKRTYADTRKPREQVNYEPNTSVNVGVRKFVSWFLSYKAQQ
ncbi:MAG: GDP-mannose 4,6-dehydratase [Cytophagales bacterium]|nr:GDP-mannose 4,6-dehydratase [Cytophagales bacterium]